jgi:hypothetical protein
MMMTANVVGFKEEADAGEKGAIVASPPVASFQPPHPLFVISATTKHGTALDHTGENFVAEAFTNMKTSKVLYVSLWFSPLTKAK